MSTPQPPLELSALERGAGPAVTLIHGGGFHSGPTWAKQIGPLAEEGYRVIAVDRRGYGRSPGNGAEPGTRIPIALQAEDVMATLDLREVGRTHLAGISYGALVALEAALRYPERVRSLTLIEPVIFGWLWEDPDYLPWVTRFAELESLAATGAAIDGWLDEWLALMDANMARALAPGSPARTVLERALPRQWEQQRPAEYTPDPVRLGALAVPTLIVNGGDSEPALHAVAGALSERLRNARSVTIAGVGHQLHAERPDLFNELFVQFLATQPALPDDA